MSGMKRFHEQGFCFTIFSDKNVNKDMYTWENQRLLDDLEGPIFDKYCNKCIHRSWRLLGKSCTGARFDFATEVPDIEPDYNPLKE